MNFKFFAMMAALSIFIAGCQNGGGDDKESYLNIYKTALSYSDFEVATHAAYDMLVRFPEEKGWKDSLAALYFTRKAFPQTILLTEEILKDRADDARILALSANSYRAIGNSKKALEHFESLFKANGDIFHLYEIANIQYNLKRVNECLLSANKLLENPDIEKRNVELLFNKQKQVVPMKAAVLNLKGVLAKDVGKKDEARALFEEAIKIYPDFLLAKGNLEEM